MLPFIFLHIIFHSNIIYIIIPFFDLFVINYIDEFR